MKGFQIQFSNIDMKEALEQIELLGGLDPKQRNCLLILTEEMFSMMNNVLRNREASFELIREDNTYSLELAANVHMTEDDKKILKLRLYAIVSGDAGGPHSFHPIYLEFSKSGMLKSVKKVEDKSIMIGA